MSDVMIFSTSIFSLSRINKTIVQVLIISLIFPKTDCKTVFVLHFMILP